MAPPHQNSSYSTHIPISSEVLNDLCSRFIVNHDAASKGTAGSTKLCYQLELAYWFYIDFERTDNPSLPSVSFSEFSFQVLSHVASLKHLANNVDVLMKEWRQFKSQVPTYGCIILDTSCKFCLLVHGFSSSNSWSFPKGKVNEGETPQQCALREVEEEVGIDFSDKIRGEHYIDKELSGRKTRLYFVTDVPFKTQFSPKCRGEIRDIRWFPIDSLPRYKSDLTCVHVLGMQSVQFFMVIPFVEDILMWVKKWTSGKMSPRTNHNHVYSTTHSPHHPSSNTPERFYDNLRDNRAKQRKNARENPPSANGSPSLPDQTKRRSVSNSDPFYENVKSKPASTVGSIIATSAKKHISHSKVPEDGEPTYSNTSQFQPIKEKSAPSFFEHHSKTLTDFKVDLKRVMMAWDGWP